MKRISVLGSTGSIGSQTLDIIRNNKDDYKVNVLVANSNIEILYEQVKEFKPQIVAIADETKYLQLKSIIGNKSNIQILAGEQGIIEAASYIDVDIVVSAIVGISGLKPTYHAISSDRTIALANKETLVTAGRIIMDKIVEKKASLLPIDSEHSAIFQCINENYCDIANIILTASGGPFRNKSKQDLENVSLAEALNHPNWAMGSKISIDSATYMNKGLEVIEARWLFNVPSEKIKVIVHPQSIIHSMVEYIDGSIIAQLGTADMRTPIQYALTYPNRKTSLAKPLDFLKVKQLTFEEPDLNRFPCLGLAYEALEQGDSSCIVLNCANEIAVDYFIKDKIKFTEIYKLVYKALEKHKIEDIKSIDDVFRISNWAKCTTREMLKERCLQ